MEFAFTDEQLMIRDTAQAFLAEVSASAAVRTAMATELGYDAGLWRRICAELCWPAIHIPEQYQGMGLGYVELVAMQEQMGRYLLCSPFFATVCMGVNALLVAGTEAQRQQFLPGIIAGDLTSTLAFMGGGRLWQAEAVTATAEQQGDTWVLNGSYQYVVDGHSAALLIVAARTPGSTGAEGISLFCLPDATAGVHRHWRPTMDQTRKLADITLDNVQLAADACMGQAGAAGPLLQKILDLATIALAAEQVGVAQQALDMTVAYTKERVQFGRSIASFQAVKHQAADMMLQAEVARSAVYYAACIAQEALQGGSLGAELHEAASVAKAWCSDAAFANAGDAIQLHGGVGFTWEYDVHLYFKRAKSSESLLGNASAHRERIAVLLLDEES